MIPKILKMIPSWSAGCALSAASGILSLKLSLVFKFIALTKHVFKSGYRYQQYIFRDVRVNVRLGAEPLFLTEPELSLENDPFVKEGSWYKSRLNNTSVALSDFV